MNVGTSAETSGTASVTRDRRFLIGAILIFVGLLVVTVGSTNVEYSDFDRNVIALRAVSEGAESVYDTLGRLDPTVDPDVRENWVAHSPISIASIKGMLEITDDPEPLFRLASIISVGVAGLILVAGVSLEDRRSVLALLVALIVSAGMIHEVFVVNGAGVVLLGVVGFVRLANSTTSRGQTAAAILLGVLVAFRPWLAPLIAFQATRSQLIRRVVIGGTAGALLTVIGAIVIGGPDEIIRFLQVALPANVTQARPQGDNLSLTRLLPDMVATAGLVVASALAMWAAWRRHTHRASGLALIAITGFSPLVWPHYWIVVGPLAGLYLLTHTDRGRTLVAVAAVAFVASGALMLAAGGPPAGALRFAYLVPLGAIVFVTVTASKTTASNTRSP